MASDQKVNVLLVDDNAENLVALESVLEDPGLHLVKAYSGLEALKHLLDEDFAVILLDVKMPGIDGFETAALIRARERTRHIPIIFLTAINTSETHIFQGYSVGALDYVVKPFEPEVLRAKVAAFIQIYRNTRKLQDEIAHRQKTEAELDASNALLETISRALMDFIADGDQNRTFLNLMNSLLTLTHSEIGFVSEILTNTQGEPTLRMFAAVESRKRRGRGNSKVWEDAGPNALALKRLCSVIKTERRPFIAGDPKTIAQRLGTSLAETSLHNFLALPLLKADCLVGIVGIANRVGGYDDALVASLTPFCHTCAIIIDAYRNAQRRKLAEDALRDLNEDLECRVTERTSELKAANRDLQDQILERRRAEEVLARQKRHIENLNERLRRAMTETHHRVKNNLQIIAAMLDMRVMESETHIPSDEIRRLGVHVRTLAAVHDLLTQEAKEDGNAHYLSAYMLLSHLLPMLQETAEGCVIRYRLEEVRLSARQGTSLALVVNELISNAIKYGKGQIEVNLAIVENRAVLSVHDDGSGFPMDFDPVGAARTGLDLIQHLSRWDLGGEVSFQNHPQGGGYVIITIPLAENESTTMLPA